MSFFIIIRGSAGVGKSTIAKKLTEVLGGYHFFFDEIMRENKLDTIVGDGIPTENFVKANELVIPRAMEKLKEKCVVIFDGCFYRKEQIKNLKKNLPFKYYVFSLKASLKECLERNKARKKPMTKKTIEEVYHLVSKLETGIEIETSGKNVMEVVNEILKYLPKKEY